MICFSFFFVIIFFFAVPHSMWEGYLVPRPRIEPMTPEVEAQNLNHWTTGEVPFASTFEIYSHWV